MDRVAVIAAVALGLAVGCAGRETSATGIAGTTTDSGADTSTGSTAAIADLGDAQTSDETGAALCSDRPLADAQGDLPVPIHRDVGGRGSAHAGDVDKNGLLDAIVVGGGGIEIFLDRGGGDLAESLWWPIVASFSSGALVDFDGDGALDVVALDRGKRTVVAAFGNDMGGLAGSATLELDAPLHDLAIARLDGATPVAIVTSDAGSYAIALASASMLSPTLLGPDHVSVIAAGDLDGDGRDDLVGARGKIMVMRTLADGGSAPPTEYEIPGYFGSHNDIALADVDLDGAVDVVLGYSGSQTVSYGDGRGGLADAEPFESPVGAVDSIVVGDFTGDGLPDVMMLAYGGTAYAQINLGDRVWLATPPTVVGMRGDGLGAGDLDGDCQLDALFVDTEDPDHADRSQLRVLLSSYN